MAAVDPEPGRRSFRSSASGGAILLPLLVNVVAGAPIRLGILATAHVGTTIAGAATGRVRRQHVGNRSLCREQGIKLLHEPPRSSGVGAARYHEVPAASIPVMGTDVVIILDKRATLDQATDRP